MFKQQYKCDKCGQIKWYKPNEVPDKCACELETYNDWRLPTIEELFTLINYNKHNPACDLKDTTSSNYWNINIYVSNSSYVWSVDFTSGYISYYNKSIRLYVRCVRDGENGLEWSKTSDNIMIWEEALDYADNLVSEVYYRGE